jgi:hypothetical protein
VVRWLDRALALADDDGPVPASKLTTFQVIFLLVLGTEYWARAIRHGTDLSVAYTADLAVATVCCAVGLALPRWRRLAFAGLALSHLYLVWTEFPVAGNHAYFELLLCAVCALLDPHERRERHLLLQSVRWMVISILFYSGVHKLLYGYYFRGQYLAYALWMDTFRPVLRLLLPSGEFERLAAYSRDVGQGPYLVDAPLFVAASNGVYVAEIGLALLLLWRPTRILGVLGAVTLLLAIEAAAREFFFGLVFANAIALFLPGVPHRRFLEPVAILLAYLLLVRLGFVPEVIFH